ncbi:uncharacterized protein LOC127724967 [Mytilus californianus]|uniref:uncharacterized protein LOC127724967 n=1 Tax=Mytilus californianus TaxID=6549 RepID=UPI002245F1E5|nr:uncharacterized protein LOC127724967 [Mytilus californianus]
MTDTSVDVASGLTDIVPVSVHNDESTTQLTQTIMVSKIVPKEHTTQEPTSTVIHSTQEPTSIAINTNLDPEFAVVQTEQKSLSDVPRMTLSTKTDHGVFPLEETTIRNVQQQQVLNNVKTSGIPLTPITAGTVVGVSAVGVIAYFGVAKLVSKLRWSSAVKPKDQRDNNMTRPRINKTDDYGLTFRPSEDDDERRRRRQLEEMIDLNHV